MGAEVGVPNAWLLVTTSASFHPCVWLAEAPAEPYRQKTHQKNLIYCKNNPTKHISAILKCCLGRRSKRWMHSLCHNAVPAQCCLCLACVDGHGGQLHVGVSVLVLGSPQGGL